jgi:hypothetical protein
MIAVDLLRAFVADLAGAVEPASSAAHGRRSPLARAEPMRVVREPNRKAGSLLSSSRARRTSVWRRPAAYGHAGVGASIQCDIGTRCAPGSGTRANVGVQLLWHRRTTDQLAGGQVRIVVPLRGGSLTPAASAPLSRLLDRLWVDSLTPPAFTSVVAMIGKPTSEDQRELTLLLGHSATPGRVARTSELLMFRQLRGALRQLDGPTAAIA